MIVDEITERIIIKLQSLQNSAVKSILYQNVLVKLCRYVITQMFHSIKFRPKVWPRHLVTKAIESLFYMLVQCSYYHITQMLLLYQIIIIQNITN